MVAVILPIESYCGDEFFTGQLESALILRGETHASQNFMCWRPCCKAEAAAASDAAAAATAAATATAVDNDEANSTDINDATAAEEKESEEPPTKKQRTVNKSSHFVDSQKQQFEVQNVPNSHAVTRKDEYARLQLMQEKVKNIQNALERQRFMQDASPSATTSHDILIRQEEGQEGEIDLRTRS